MAVRVRVQRPDSYITDAANIPGMVNLSSPKQASDLLKAHGLRAQKRLGQNFLCDRNTLSRIVGAANLTSNDRVVEIGGGLGALTLALADISLSVTSIEIDRNLEPILSGATADAHNVRLVFEDFFADGRKAALS